jgi:hypothetical protein
MVDQLNKSAEEEAQLRKGALASNGAPLHGSGYRDVIDKSNPDAKSGRNKDGVRPDN